MNGYDYKMLLAEISALKKEYGKELTVTEIGKSLCGRSLPLLILGKGEPILVAACFHGMEHITAALCMGEARRLCERKRKNDPIFAQRKFYLVPCVNPDGVEISLYGAARAGEYEDTVRRFAEKGKTDNWQANARGVDLNHNFDAGWQKLKEIEKQMGYRTPGPTRFGGYFPHSEPEVIALVNLCRKVPFARVMACHSQGEEIYYSFGGPQKEGERLARKMGMVSGYRAASPQGEIASYGGFKDWFIQEFQKPGFTVEFGKGKNPLPLSDLSKTEAKAQKLFRVFEES